MENKQPTSSKELAGLFLKLGFTAFGGPAAHIAMMQKEVVERRQWMSHAYFLDLISATNLIPGPNSTEMAIHIGQERGGWKGLLIAGACFILPAVFITGFIAWIYQQYGQLPAVSAFTYGIKPAIIAIILSAAFPLARRVFRTATDIVIGSLALLAALWGGNEIFVLFGTGLVVLLLKSRRRLDSLSSFFSPLNIKLFLVFLKIGAILYGSGYVLFAFLDKELVAKGLLSRAQLVDAIAVGQFTPGPVFSSVTFIGWQINGWTGAAISTLAIFLPSFVFVALLNPLIPGMRRSRLFGAFLDGVNIASVAIILTVCFQFGKETLTGWRTILIALLSGIVVFGFPRVNTVFVVLGSALAGWLLQLI